VKSGDWGVPVSTAELPRLNRLLSDTSVSVAFAVGFAGLSALFYVVFTPTSAVAYAGFVAAICVLLWEWVGRRLLSGRATFVLVMILTGFYGITLGDIPIGGFSVFPYRILLGVALLGATGIWLANGASIRVSRHPLRWYYGFLAAWFLYGAVSLVWSTAPAASIHELLVLGLALILVVLCAESLSTASGVRHFKWLWIAMLAVFLVVGILENQLGLHIRTKIMEMPTLAALYRPRGPFHNTNDFATLLALSMPFAMVLMARGRRSSGYVLGGVLFGAGIYMIRLTGSRAGMASVLLETVVFVLFIVRRKARWRFVGTMAVLACMVATFAPGYLAGILASLQSIAVQLSRGVGSAATRLGLVRSSLSALISSYGLGVGAGNIQPWIAARGGAGSGVSSVHNWWLEILGSYGILVFAGYVAFYLGLIRALVRARRTALTDWERRLSEGLIVSLVGFSLASIGPSSIMALRAHWLLFAFALAFVYHARRSRQGFPAP